MSACYTCLLRRTEELLDSLFSLDAKTSPKLAADKHRNTPWRVNELRKLSLQIKKLAFYFAFCQSSFKRIYDADDGQGSSRCAVIFILTMRKQLHDLIRKMWNWNPAKTKLSSLYRRSAGVPHYQVLLQILVMLSCILTIEMNQIQSAYSLLSHRMLYTNLLPVGCKCMLIF